MNIFIYEVGLWLGCRWIPRSKEKKHFRDMEKHEPRHQGKLRKREGRRREHFGYSDSIIDNSSYHVSKFASL